MLLIVKLYVFCNNVLFFRFKLFENGYKYSVNPSGTECKKGVLCMETSILQMLSMGALAYVMFIFLPQKFTAAFHG